MRPLPAKAGQRRGGLTRPFSADRPQAAAELVRLEYERDRLVRALDALDRNTASTRGALDTVEARIRDVQTHLMLTLPEPGTSQSQSFPTTVRRSLR